MAKDVPGQLVPVVVNYYFIDTLHALFEAIDHCKQLITFPYLAGLPGLTTECGAWPR